MKNCPKPIVLNALGLDNFKKRTPTNKREWNHADGDGLWPSMLSPKNMKGSNVLTTGSFLDWSYKS